MSTGRMDAPARSKHGEGVLKRGRHRGLDLGHRVGRAERELLRLPNGVTHRLPQREHVCGCVREEAERVEALREREHALEREQPVGRLESRDAAIGGRPQHRPPRLRSERERHHARRDGGRRSAGASAGRMREIARVARWRRACGTRKRSYVFSRAGSRRAGEARARWRRPRYRCARGNRRTELRGKASRLDDVLRGEWNPGQRSCARRLLRRDLDPGVDGRVHRRNAIETSLKRALALRARGVHPVGERFQVW